MKKIDGERRVADARFCIHNGKRERERALKKNLRGAREEEETEPSPSLFFFSFFSFSLFFAPLPFFPFNMTSQERGKMMLRIHQAGKGGSSSIQRDIRDIYVFLLLLFFFFPYILALIGEGVDLGVKEKR
ncbi:hypothetical protein TRV_05298 [Trichophyton verrucosum HKI 0517]|uniref:Transmembrane protein n=1 Tax=Trichophyton verrucosum (strain HKI 0517) TaxID=663202 RepID=D4DDT6_TRIVH|nr:uncharacterized protein TRV_05298 [Trichophyton verrucosum HKI 0517]EFE40003.1 hypothetical protein TRV_05298 [Trichophyton verrucosum HKI 0517]